jgi:hypothetical protein
MRFFKERQHVVMMESYQKLLIVLDGCGHLLMGLISYKRIFKIY